MLHKISHRTEYAFGAPVDYGLQKLRLHPSDGPLQIVREWKVDIDGGQIEASHIDHYGNHVDLVRTSDAAEGLTITAHGMVETIDQNGVLGMVYGRAPLWHFLSQTRLTKPSEAITALASIAQAPDRLTALHDLSAAILDEVPYIQGSTNTMTTAAEALDLESGVCQDHTHIFLSAARVAGVPARYVSGYLHMPATDNQDATHAWAEAHVDGLGWVGFDISNGISPDEHYVRLAVGRDAQDATPVYGMRRGAGDASLIVSLQVQQ
jgi:transglutaminase-like putative cysteine protease